MPRIPNATDIQRAQPQIRGGVVDVHNPYAGAGARTIGESLGGLLGEIEAKKQRDREDALVESEYNVAIGMEKLANSYHQDPEYGSIMDRANAGMNELIGNAASNIPDARERELFVAKQKLAAERVRTKLGGIVWDKEKSDRRGSINGQLEDAREAALTGDPGVFSTLTRKRLDAAAAKGYYTEEEADGIYRKWQDSVAVGRLTLLEPEERLKALSEPWAENLPLDTRIKLKREAQELTRVGKAQSFADGLFQGDPGITLTNGLDAIRTKITDPDDRAEAEARFKSEYNTRRIDRQNQRNDITNTMTDQIDEGATLSQLMESDEWDALGVTQKNAVKNYAMGGSTRTESDPHIYDRAVQLKARGEWEQLREFTLANVALLSPSNREGFLKAAADQSAGQSLTVTQTVNSLMAGETNKARKGRMVMDIAQWTEEHTKRTGKEPSSEDIRKEVALRLLDTGTWFSNNAPINAENDAQMRQRVLDHTVTESRDEDPERTDAVLELLNVKFGQGNWDRYDFTEMTNRLIKLRQMTPPAPAAPVVDPNRTILSEFDAGDLPDAAY